MFPQPANSQPLPSPPLRLRRKGGSVVPSHARQGAFPATPQILICRSGVSREAGEKRRLHSLKTQPPPIRPAGTFPASGRRDKDSLKTEPPPIRPAGTFPRKREKGQGLLQSEGLLQSRAWLQSHASLQPEGSLQSQDSLQPQASLQSQRTSNASAEQGSALQQRVIRRATAAGYPPGLAVSITTPICLPASASLTFLPSLRAIR